MAPKRQEDLRVLRTKQSIRRAFTEMICEMDYERITVQELTARAMINRKTFYLHYPTLDDLLREVQREMAEDFIRRTEGMERPRDMDKITREFFLCSEELGKLGERLNCSDTHVRRQITDEIMRRTWRSLKGEPEAQNIIMAFVSQATLAIYRQWTADGKAMPLEEVIELATRLICHGVGAIFPSA